MHVCKDDADTKIVSTSLEIAQESPVTVVADDTDIAVMLLYHWNENIFDIFLLQERGKQCWSMKECKSQMSVMKQQYLLFVQAWSGCDSMSAILGKGEPSFFQFVEKYPTIQSASEIMSDFWGTKNEVEEFAVKIFIQLYGGQDGSSLQKLRLVSITYDGSDMINYFEHSQNCFIFPRIIQVIAHHGRFCQTSSLNSRLVALNSFDADCMC